MDLLPDRMPPLARETMDDLQRAAADELIAGPRQGVKVQPPTIAAAATLTHVIG